MATLKPPLPPTPTSPTGPPLALTIRFSADNVPDVDLDIPHPSTTTVVSLKHLIRSHLIEPNSQRRLRFIQGGKILPDGAALSTVLRLPPPPPPPASPRLGFADVSPAAPSSAAGSEDPKGKGKNVLNRPVAPRIYINCSIGDSLTDAELSEEAAAAALPVSATAPNAGPQSRASSPFPSLLPPSSQPQQPSTLAAPRGFDRLLSTGFTPAEVNQLRLQFRSIHSSRFTPDTLPSPDSFRRMEDNWIDNNGAANIPSAGSAHLGPAGAGGAGGFEGEESGLVAHIDALIWGVMTGYMWPLGSFGWLVREPGIHSDRWKFMVGVGVLFSVLIGIVRGISGEQK